MGAAIVEGDPVAGFRVLPEDDLAVQELKGSGQAGIKILDEGNRVPVVSP